jgi:hypothetical protein
LGEFEHTGTYVNLELSSTKPKGKGTSPGCDSVLLKQVDEMEAAAILYQPPTAKFPHSTRIAGNEINKTTRITCWSSSILFDPT